jgi:glycerophosphoryl diester phosphodiesterase
VEADVHLFAGRLEVRHRKTVGPIPILWDRWELAPPWAPRMLLEDLLEEAAPGTGLMLDLKGHDLRLPGRIVRAIGETGTAGRVTVCSQDWRLLEPLRELPDVRVVHSVGNARQLARLRRHLAGKPLAGVSIHRRLLDTEVVADLRRRAELVLSWPVESVAQARTLAAWGVQGLISQSFERLAPALAGQTR